MNSWVKRVLVTGLAVALVLIGLLSVLAAIAHSRGVRTAAVPAPSLIAIPAGHADYFDAYSVTVPPERFHNLHDVIAVAFQKGHEVGRSPTEVVYQDCAPGLVFDVAYQLTVEDGRSVLTMTTAVRYTNAIGPIYFGLVRPFHRRLVPFMISRMAR